MPWRAVVATVSAALALQVSMIASVGPRPVETGSAHPSFWVATFVERADLRAAVREPNWDRRGRLAVIALRRAYRTAAARPRVTKLLRRNGVRLTPLWVSNAVLFHSSKVLADRVAQISGVTEVVGGKALDLDGEITATRGRAGTLPGGTPANLAAAHVPEARAAGLTGAGTVVGIVDTGVDVTHPDLASGFRRRAGWFDPAGRCADAPCDDGGHGTAVAGLAVGSRTGVAPGAQWIAARGCTQQGCTLELVLRSLQFMIAPDPGTGPDPGLRPDVVNNSWSIDEPSTALGRAMTAMHAAGVLDVFAAGNAGPRCATVGFPASQPETVAVGAADDAGGVAAFSARGPGRFGSEPALVAPGVAVMTTAVGGGYTEGTGTSMAAPQVTGTYALVFEAAPRSERGSAALSGIVATSATPRPETTCSSRGVPNSAYGYGTLDAAAAVAAARRAG